MITRQMSVVKAPEKDCDSSSADVGAEHFIIRKSRRGRRPVPDEAYIRNSYLEIESYEE